MEMSRWWTKYVSRVTRPGAGGYNATAVVVRRMPTTYGHTARLMSLYVEWLVACTKRAKRHVTHSLGGTQSQPLIARVTVCEDTPEWTHDILLALARRYSELTTEAAQHRAAPDETLQRFKNDSTVRQRVRDDTHKSSRWSVALAHVKLTRRLQERIAFFGDGRVSIAEPLPFNEPATIRRFADYIAQRANVAAVVVSILGHDAQADGNESSMPGLPLVHVSRADRG